MFPMLDTVETPDEKTVVFNLKVPDATFPSKIASGAGSIVDHSAVRRPTACARTARPSAPAPTSWTRSTRTGRLLRQPELQGHRRGQELRHHPEVLPRRPDRLKKALVDERRRHRLPRPRPPGTSPTSRTPPRRRGHRRRRGHQRRGPAPGLQHERPGRRTSSASARPSPTCSTATPSSTRSTRTPRPRCTRSSRPASAATTRPSSTPTAPAPRRPRPRPRCGRRASPAR